MSSEEGFDEELSTALTVTPLVHLAPKQNLSSLINPLLFPEPASLALAIKHLDVHDNNILELLGQDLLDFQDDTETIHFKQFPCLTKTTSEITTSSVENRLLDLQSGNQYLTPMHNNVQSARLSIRKKYDLSDMTLHNQTYERKFSKEIFRERPAPLKRHIDEPQPSRKIIKFSDSDLRKNAVERVETLIKESSIDGQKLNGVLEAIRLVHKDLDIDGCAKLQKLCRSYLVDTMDILNKAGLSDLQNIQENLHHVQGCLVASSCIIWIMSDNIGSNSLLVGEYVVEIANLVYLIVNSVLVSVLDVQNKDNVLDIAWVTRIVSEVASLLKQLGRLNSKLSLEEEALTKLELTCIQLIFEETFTHGRLTLFPIDPLRYSAALFIIDVYEFSTTQRSFLLNELIVNFLRLPVKKMDVRNYQIERGNKIMLYSMICIRICQVKDGTAERLSSGLIQRVVEKFDSTSKSLFEYLIEDLNLMLPYPEWAGSLLLLKVLVEQVLDTLLTKENAPPTEVYFLDVLGNTCKNVLVLKNSTSVTDKAEVLLDCSRYGGSRELEYMKELLLEHNTDKFCYTLQLLKELDGFCSVFLTSLVHFLESPKIKSKTKTVKILAMLSEYHPSLLSSTALQQSLSARLCDEATLVRDAVYEFLGKYIRSHPYEADKYCSQLCNALSDEGISVRKKAIRLSKDIYPMFGTEAKISIGTRLLKRLNDEEDNIKNESVYMMMECWITPLGNSDKSRLAVQELINLATSHHKTLENLELFLESYVFKKPDALKLTDCLMETLLDFVAEDSNSKEGALLLLSICSKCKPELMGQNKLIALQPYLVDENNCSTKSYRFALGVLKNVLPTVTALRPDFINPVQSFLLKKLTRFSNKELHEAVPSLWQFCKIKKDFLKMVNAAISTIKMMRKYLDNQDLKRDNRLAKLLQLLSNLINHCELEKHREAFLNANIGLKQNEPVVSLAVKYISSFCQSSNPLSVEIIAVSSLLVTCTNYPRILMSPPVLAIFDDALSCSTPEMIKSVIQSMIVFLREKDRPTSSSKSSLEDIIDDACPGIVQRYINRILLLSLSDKGEYSYLPFQFVQVALELGFANPKICMPTVMALEASPVVIIQSSAINMHKELFEKHESLVDSSYQEGIRLAFDNQLMSVLFFKVVHEIVQVSRSSRNRFIQAICKSMSLDKISFLLFCIERVLMMSFKSMEEILLILTELQDNVHSVDPDSIEYNHALAACAMIELYRHLTSVYKISDDQVESFGTGAFEVDQKHTPKEVRHAALSLEWYHRKINDASNMEQCIKNIKEFT